MKKRINGRAIIIDNDEVLLMFRNIKKRIAKHPRWYY